MPRTPSREPSQVQPTKKPYPAHYNARRNRISLQIPDALDDAIHRVLAEAKRVNPAVGYSDVVRQLIRAGLGQ